MLPSLLIRVAKKAVAFRLEGQRAIWELIAPPPNLPHEARLEARREFGMLDSTPLLRISVPI